MKKSTKIFSLLLSAILVCSVFLSASLSISATAEWQIMFDWEDQTVGSAPTCTTTSGANQTTTVRVSSLVSGETGGYNANGQFTSQLLQGSTKAAWFYGAKIDESTPSGHVPSNSSTPASINLNTSALAGATDLRVNLHIKQKSYATEDIYFGVAINGVYYYEKLTKSNYYTATYYNFVGKTLTSAADSSVKTITAEDIQNATALIGWVNTIGESAVLVDNVEYYKDEVVVPTTTTLAPSTEGPKKAVYGDANADGKINMADVLILRKYLAKWDVVLGK